MPPDPVSSAGVSAKAGTCTCYVRGEHDEHPRKRVIPHRVVRPLGRKPFYLPPVDTDDPRCPVHGIAGRKVLRACSC